MNTIVNRIADAIRTADTTAGATTDTTADTITAAPRTRLDLVTPSEDDRAFLAFINSNLFGQPAAKEMLLRIHRAAKNPFRDRTRPIYKALMPGDSHTGKTETACVLADYYHGNPEAFIRINCANYKNKGDISRLLGTGPGWVGYQKPPTDEELVANKDKFDASALLSAQNLTASRKGSKTPYTIVLLDEFEKAGDEFEQFILAIYSAAKERMGNNQEVDFSDCIFLMPCNLGMSEIAQKQNHSIGFVTNTVDTASELDGIITRRYPIEVVNRFDEVCIYGKLTRDDVNNVLGLHIKKVQKRVDAAYGDSAFTIVVEESARKRLLELCLNDRGDVADLKRVVPRRLTDPVSVAVETGVIGAGDELIVSCEDGKEICFDRAGNGPVQKLDGSKLPKEAEPTALQKEAAVPKRRVNLDVTKLVIEAAGLVKSGEERQAQLVLERALIVMAKAPDDLMAVRVNNMLGLLLHKNRVYGEAVKYFADAVDARAALEVCHESLPFGIVFGNLAMALSHDGRKQKALEFMADGMTAIRLYSKSETDDGLKHFMNTFLGIDASKAKQLIEFSISLREPN